MSKIERWRQIGDHLFVLYGHLRNQRVDQQLPLAVGQRREGGNKTFQLIADLLRIIGFYLDSIDFVLDFPKMLLDLVLLLP